MSILKGILHHWNETSSAYDTIHPETEVAQVTDWNKGIVNTLASTGLSSLVNVLSSDSLLALLIKKVFDATGVKYSLGQNGYVCWGALFGGVITQWGYVESTNSNTRIYLPINALPVSVVMNDENTVANDLSISTTSYTSGSFVVCGSRRDGNTVIWGHWVAVCI